jgi:hypothetical protein
MVYESHILEQILKLPVFFDHSLISLPVWKNSFSVLCGKQYMYILSVFVYLCLSVICKG